MGVYDHKFIGGFISQLRKFNQTLAAKPIPESKMEHIEWDPHNTKLKADHYNILYYIAKYTKVKVMWREKLEEDATTVKKIIWVIGERNRIMIFEAIATHWFIGQYEFERWVKQNDRHMSKGMHHKSIRSYSSYLLEQQADMLTVFLKGILDFDPSYELHLEGYVKERYKLDYKKYNTDHPEYYHAISNKFHHKRMLL